MNDAEIDPDADTVVCSPEALEDPRRAQAFALLDAAWDSGARIQIRNARGGEDYRDHVRAWIASRARGALVRVSVVPLPGLEPGSKMRVVRMDRTRGDKPAILIDVIHAHERGA